MTRALLGAGTTSIRHSFFGDPGRMYEAFFGLSQGIERLSKLILVCDQYQRTGRFPPPGEVENYRHNLTRLVRDVEAVASANGVDLVDAPSANAGSKAVVGFLNKFAEKDRYYNLNRLTQGDGATIDDPISRWVTLVRTYVPERRVNPGQQRQDAMHRGFARYMDENVPLAIIDHVSLSGDRLSSFEAMTTQLQDDKRIGVEGMLLAIRPIRFLSHTISTLDYGRGLPVFTEFFDDWMMPDSYLRRRRRFPLHRS
ncbi:hypothetical protein QBL02_06310 [Leucobacter sp. UT-8R-CII-1-4]|uniref:hypothetical protein n=1 Tax=Leucobacter sp. UT-8R-CII-1-4 TaxID=3040075 RepID=UPI0024A816F1|nr:hypothetical protein [Leucobacter sp. UT-8R-CII-1-4]MDI6023155.1 hypothetical protein [Leucobacter sp. UT-8R-CII-1-4]